MKTCYPTLKTIAPALMLALSVVSCSKQESSLLATIPNDTKFVMATSPADLAKKIDLKKITSAGIKSDMETIIRLLSGDAGIDLKQFAVFEYDRELWCTFAVTDAEKLKTTSGLEKSMEKGPVTVFFNDDKIKIAVSGNQGWMVGRWDNDVQDIAETVSKFQKTTEEKSVLSVPAFAENMEGSDLNCYINMHALYAPLANDMNRQFESSKGKDSLPPFMKEAMESSLFASVNFEKDDLKAFFRMIDKNGENVFEKFKFADLDMGMLQFFDAKTPLMLALALPEDTMDLYSQLLFDYFSSASRGELGIAAKTLLDALDGNIAASISIPAFMGLGNNDLSVVARLKKDHVANVEALLLNTAKDFGLEKSADGSFALQLAGTTANVSVREGYLLVSTIRQPGKTTYADTENAQKFKGKQGALLLDIPENSELASFISMGLGKQVSGFAYLGADSKQGEFTIHVDNNPEQNILNYFFGLAR